jgi:hypothetical protein
MVDRPNPRARVFISCGQNKLNDEVQIAKDISSRLERLGYDAYVATQEQTLRGLRENIFQRLENSEYFVFIDFKREELGRKDPPEYRGSLFSHQELAIASYLEKPTLILQETGIKELDGILFCLQTNIEPFTDRRYLPNIIADKIQERREWDSRWRHDLSLRQHSRPDGAPDQFYDVDVINVNKKGRFFLIDVHNRHRDKIASNCYAYLEKAIQIDIAREFLFRTCELKWSGYVLPNAHILPRAVRALDAFWVPHDAPDQLVFQLYTDSGLYVPIIKGKGTYELQYMVIADGFPVARCIATVSLDGTTLPTTLTVR